MIINEMQKDKQIIYYETLHCKFNWKYTTFIENNYEISKIEDVLIEEDNK